MTATTRDPRPAGSLDGEQLERLDRVAARSRAGADALRAIGDRHAVDGIEGRHAARLSAPSAA